MISDVINGVKRKLAQRKMILEAARLRERNKNRSEEEMKRIIEVMEAKTLETVENCTEKLVR